MKVLVVIGTRPEAIKMVPVVGELRRRSDDFETAVCLTAQHRRVLARETREPVATQDLPDLDLSTDVLFAKAQAIDCSNIDQCGLSRFAPFSFVR